MLVLQECIPIDSPSEWREALKGIEHAFAHTWENCYAMHLTTGYSTYLYRFETEDVRIVCPIAERRFQGYVDVVTPYGFSGFVGNDNYEGFSNHWARFVEQRGYVCGFIGMNPVFENNSYFEQNQMHTYNEIYLLDLALGKDQLFANLNKNRKRQLKARKNPSTIILLDREMLADFFLANYSEFFRERGASGAYRFSKETLSFLLSLDNVLIVGAGKPGKVEAVTVFAYTPYVADFLFNVSLTEGRHHSVSLLWHGLSHLKSIRIPLLNLGGGIRPNDSLAHFKQRFGGTRLALRCLKQVYKPEVYAELCRRVNADPTDMIGYFPSYRKP